MNMFDAFFEKDLEALNKAEENIQGTKFDPRGPFVNGCDLDWNDDKQVEELYEYGAEPSMIGRRG